MSHGFPRLMSETSLYTANNLSVPFIRKPAVQNLDPLSHLEDRIPISSQPHFSLLCLFTLWAAIHLPQSLRVSFSHFGTALFLDLLYGEGTMSLLTASLSLSYTQRLQLGFLESLCLGHTHSVCASASWDHNSLCSDKGS